jgi:hypothetical protein
MKSTNKGEKIGNLSRKGKGIFSSEKKFPPMSTITEDMRICCFLLSNVISSDVGCTISCRLLKKIMKHKLLYHIYSETFRKIQSCFHKRINRISLNMLTRIFFRLTISYSVIKVVMIL